MVVQTAPNPFSTLKRPAVIGCEAELRDPVESARAAGLRYVTDAEPGYRRVGEPGAFSYVNGSGGELTDEAQLERIRKLALPPAWTDVWITKLATGHLQATGRDARGRKQYRYHAKWRQVRDEVKYGRLVAFGELLPEIRRRTDADLRRPGLPREKALAAIVHLLESTLIRVGNDEYARDNKSFGLTTLRDRHVEVDGASLRFKFRGKSGKEHAVGIRDRRLASTIRRMRDLPGQELCQYLDDNGDGQPLGSGDVNDYLRDITGRDVTAKDFRTWAGTLLAAVILHDAGPPDSAADARRTIVQTVEMVADRLGNTPAIARKCYIHPFVLDAFTEGHAIQPRTPRRSPGEHDLSPQEAALMRFLRDAPGAA